MALSTASASELTAEQVQRILVQPLEEQSVFLSSGPRIFDTDGSQIRIPKMGGPTDPSWHGENELITEVEASFDEVTLLPSTLQSIKTLTRFSNSIARQSVVALDAALRDRLVRDVATKMDKQFLSSGGDGVKTPKGIFAYEGTQELPVKGELTFDTLIEAWGLALSANVNISSLKWLINPADFVALRKIKDADGRYILNADPVQDAVFRLFGSPVVVTGHLPAKSAALVDFSQIAVARDTAPSVRLLTERYADYDQQALRVVSRYDAAPLNAEGVIKLTGIGGASA